MDKNNNFIFSLSYIPRCAKEESMIEKKGKNSIYMVSQKLFDISFDIKNNVIINRLPGKITVVKILDQFLEIF